MVEKKVRRDNWWGNSEVLESKVYHWFAVVGVVLMQLGWAVLAYYRWSPQHHTLSPSFPCTCTRTPCFRWCTRRDAFATARVCSIPAMLPK